MFGFVMIEILNMNIIDLRYLVDNGWNIQNRRQLLRTIGQTEYGRLTDAYKKLSKGRLTIPVTLPTDSIVLSKQNDELMLKMSMSPVGMYCKKFATQTFFGQDINLGKIAAQMHELELKVSEYFNSVKPLPESALESKTLETLYSKEFNPLRRINEDGYFVTTLIDKTSNTPVEAYVVQACKDNEYEKWHILVKNSSGEYELVGKRSFHVNKNANRIMSSWMDSYAGAGKYAGVGLRGHQIAVERMLQEGFDTVQIMAEPQAFPFHYKSGFRVVPSSHRIDLNELARRKNKWMTTGGLSKDEVESLVVMNKGQDGRMYLSSKTYENLRKYIYLKNNGKLIPRDTPMHLEGEKLEEWILRAQIQPIIL